ncbi:MAG: zinc-ribbon domain-containing protein [Patescibacteria group bacterium]|nr:zinc-ribbon domain-containing protein [Patescibacteria group bacterium]
MAAGDLSILPVPPILKGTRTAHDEERRKAMALRLYLSNEAREHILQKIGKVIVKGIKIRFKDVPICLDADGRPYYEVKNDQLPVSEITPPTLREHVTCYSWFITLHRNCPTKTLGQYKYETATAKLDRTEDGQRIKAHIQGPNLEHVHALYRQIRVGSVSPSESWDWEEPEKDNVPPVQANAPSIISQEATQGSDKMISFTCGKCGAKYVIAADKLGGKKQILVRCQNCQNAMKVSIPDIPPPQTGGNGMLN